MSTAAGLDQVDDDSRRHALPERLLEEAARWRVQLDDPALPRETHQAFERWRCRHPDHAQAWQAINAIWDATAGASRPGAREALERTFEEEQGDARRWLGRGAGLLLILLVLMPLAWIVSGIPSPAHLLADHHTAVGEIRTVELPDGSRMVLNTATAVDVRFDDDQRRIRLHHGEIHITVAPDSRRPLEVVTDHGRARALGTRFGVRRVESGNTAITRVTVQHSRVELCPAGGDHCRELRQGQQADTDGRHVTEPVTVDPEASAAWTTGRLVADDVPVTDVLRELARYRRGFLHIDDTGLAGMRVSGVIPLHDTDRALKALESTLPLRARRYTPWVIRVSGES
ncbi:MAG: FecR family protein [Ectothiorhodospiraceae bacterium]|nr:FecR family protein [Ectothiorhodospiraceae bacterium]